MEEHITDTYEFTVEVIQHGDLAIDNVEVPQEVEAGEDFIVSYNTYNNGIQDTCFGYILDIDNESEIPNSRWQQTIATGGDASFECTITSKPTSLNAQIVVGYYTE